MYLCTGMRMKHSIITFPHCVSIYFDNVATRSWPPKLWKRNPILRKSPKSSWRLLVWTSNPTVWVTPRHVFIPLKVVSNLRQPIQNPQTPGSRRFNMLCRIQHLMRLVSQFDQTLYVCSPWESKLLRLLFVFLYPYPTRT